MLVLKLWQHPAAALVWECWRLARRWYLWVLPAVFTLDLFFMSQAGKLANRDGPGAGLTLGEAYALLAPSVFIVNFTVALFTTLLALSVGGRSGFPLAFAHRLPVRTPLLVGVPMLTLATLCASLYLLPMLLCRLLFGVPFPLLPAGALMMTLVVILLACAWSTTTTKTRTVAILFALFNSVQLFAALDPVNVAVAAPRDGPVQFNPDIVALTPGQYALLLGVSLLLFALTLSSVRKQRHGEAPLEGFTGILVARERSTPSHFASFLERVGDLAALPCPTGAPWRAELWLELKRHGMPILLLGIATALAVPLLYALGLSPPRTLERLDYVFPAVVFFGGVGIAIFNRRLATSGYMSPFEGTRGMSTIALAMLQMLSAAASILCGALLVCVSVYASSQLFVDEPGALARRLQALFATDNGGSALLPSAAIMQVVAYLSAIALFACVHAGSVVWGRVLPYGAGIMGIYGLIFTYRVQAGSAALEDIKRHMWGFAAVVLLMTLLALVRTFQLGVMTLRAGLVTAACWALFVACSLHSLAQHGIVLTQQAPELQVFNAALLILPLMLFALLFWSYDLLRHR